MKVKYSVRKKDDAGLRWYDLLDEFDLVEELEMQIPDLEEPIELSYEEDDDELDLFIITSKECHDIVKQWALDNESYIHSYQIIEK